VQIHSLFIRFHNAFMQHATTATADRPALSPEAAFATARRRVRWHYQWLVLHDFVRRIVGQDTFDEVWNDGEPLLQFYDPRSTLYPFMPVEFSVAAYRLGHSMVRPSYSLSSSIPHAKSGNLNRIAIFKPTLECGDPTSLNGFRPLLPDWGIDWSFFLPDLPRPTDQKSKDFALPQPSYRLDTLLTDPLRSLPDQNTTDPARKSLPSLNLLRGIALGLPSGQAVARRMALRTRDGKPVPVLTDQQLWLEPGNIVGKAEDKEIDALLKCRRDVYTNNRAALHQNAPLWYYILREAELANTRPVDVNDDAKNPALVPLGGWHLGPVGGRIIAEVFIGLLLADDQSFLTQHPLWEPEIPVSKPAWGLQLSDIVRFVDKG
jgi:Animal haem peroxidase